MIQQKNEFLNHIANRLGREQILEEVKRPKWKTAPQYEVHKDLSKDELVAVLEKRCHEIHTDFYRTNLKELPKTLQEILENYEATSLIYPNDERQESYGLKDLYSSLVNKNIECWMWDSEKEEENISFAEQADVGIVFSEITLAESATVTLFHHEKHGRSLSLLPQAFIAIIPKSTLVPRFTQAAKNIRTSKTQGKKLASCISFVSGPSNSADIEMNLIVGVHGPVKASYILIDDA